MNIEVGMMVEIIGCINPRNKKYIGIVGRIKKVQNKGESDGYVVDGAETARGYGFAGWHLRPIPDPQEKESFVEKHSKSWLQPIEVEA